jgi:peptide/nickel transport system substrate-binding protein
LSIRLSRRRLAAAAAIAGLTIVAGATGASFSGGAVLTGSAPDRITIDRSATIRLGSLSSTPSLDPITQSGTTTLLYNIWDRLTTFDSKGNLQPMLATSWKMAKDAKSITFTLRKDVKFHDGTPVDAAAVKASLDRARTAPGSAVASSLAGIDSVDVVNPSTVRINLKFGGAELPRLLATNAGAVVNPSCIAANTSLLMMPDQCTSGAWVLDHGTPAVEWWFKRWSGKYWDPRAFKYAGLAVILSGNVQTSINALQAGDLDIAEITPEGMEQAKSLIKSGQLAGKSIRTTAMVGLFLNPRQPPFNNRLLRQAVQAAIDPKVIANQLLSGDCVPSQQPAQPGTPYVDAKWNPNPYNPDRAKQLLAQAGSPNGFAFANVTSNISLNLGQSQVIQDMLSKVGIKMNIQPVASTAVPALRQGTADASISAWGSAVDASQAVTFIFNPGDSRLFPAVGSPVEKQLETLRYHALDPTLSEAKRGQIYQQIWKIVYDQALVVNECQLGRIWLHRTNILNADHPPYTFYSNGIDMRYFAVAGK